VNADVASADAGGRIGIAGAGAVAQALGRRLREAGVPIAAVGARDADRGARAAAFIGPAVASVPLVELAARADRILIAVSDDAIGTIAATLAGAGGCRGPVLHTSGGAGLAVLASFRTAGVACGVLHPLQTVPDPESGVRDLAGAAFAVAGDTGAVAWATELAGLAGGWALPVAEDGLAAYHAAAVLTSNASAALADAALALMAAAGVEREAALRALAPLGRASVANVFRDGPVAALTGPVARGDVATVRAHLAALAPAPASVASLYRAAGRQLVDLARRRGLPAERVEELEALLEGDTTGDA
jgi:predicted short-subunit dehydrogenase-like oxidoreductase (DUF2520 family)